MLERFDLPPATTRGHLLPINKAQLFILIIRHIMGNKSMMNTGNQCILYGYLITFLLQHCSINRRQILHKCQQLSSKNTEDHWLYTGNFLNPPKLRPSVSM